MPSQIDVQKSAKSRKPERQQIEQRPKLARRHPPRVGQPVLWRYLTPLTLVMGTVFVAPVAYTVWISLHKTNYYTVGEFSGLGAYVRLFTSSTLPTQIMTTAAFSFGALAVALPLGLASALLLDKLRKFKRTARAILLLPWLMSQATVGAIWLWFLDPSYGSASFVTDSLGWGPLTVFSTPGSALVAVTLITAWWSYPQAMLLFMGALQTIPGELKESLRVDGGNAWHSLFYVVLPYIRNTIVSVVVILLMLYVQMVTIILVTTRGGPLKATETLSMSVFNNMFVGFDLSGASATAVILFFVNTLLTLVAIKFRRKESA